MNQMLWTELFLDHKVDFKGMLDFSNVQILANSPKTQQIDSVQSHNTQENHKGHKFCVDRVRFEIF